MDDNNNSAKATANPGENTVAFSGLCRDHLKHSILAWHPGPASE